MKDTSICRKSELESLLLLCFDEATFHFLETDDAPYGIEILCVARQKYSFGWENPTYVGFYVLILEVESLRQRGK